MSRQRIRTGVLEGSSVICPHCAGAGTVRSTASVAVHVIRVLEDALIKSASHNVILRTRTVIALYILNQKRSLLRLIEERFGVSVTIEADDSLTGGAYHALERGEPASGPVPDPLRRFDPRRAIEDIEPIGEAESEAEFDEEVETETEATEGDSSEAGGEGGESGDAENRRRRRRRRGRGRNFERDASVADPNAPQPSDEGLETMAEIGGDLIAPVEAGGEEEAGSEAPREEGSEERRRGRGRWRRRGGRGSREGEAAEFAGDWRPTNENASNENEAGESTLRTESAAEADPASPPSEPSVEAAPAPIEVLTPVAAAEAAPASSETAIESAPALVAETPAVKPQPLKDLPPVEEAKPPQVPQQPELPVITAADPDKPKRSGWWARAKANLSGN
jgi:ribonuclease E